jgi:hypothetical protein
VTFTTASSSATDYKTVTVECGNSVTANIVVVEVQSVAICKPDDTGWAVLPWEQVLLKNESLRIKAAITPSLSPGTGFSIEVKAKTSSSNPTGIDVTLDELAAGGTELRKATSTSSLIASGGAEFASADKGPSYDDGSQFDSDMSSDGRTRRGLGRGSGDEDATPPEGAVSKTFLQAAGVEYLEVVYDEGETTEKKDKSQIENQADWFYYSGHGQHSTASVQLYTGSYGFGPSQATGHWSSDLGTAIFSACSVLDINDYNNNFTGSEHDRSPGEDWIGVGPNVLLGYNHNAPTDAQGTDDIIETWHANLNSHAQIEAWRIANDIGVGHNACAIDLRFSQQKYYYFHREVVWPGVEIYTWTSKSPPW